MSGRVGSITTDIIADGLVFNMDAANRASTKPISTITTSFNTVDTSISGAFSDNGIFDSSTITPSFAFGGTDDYIETSYDSTGVTGLTVSAWAKANSYGSYNCISAQFTAGNASTSSWVLESVGTSPTGMRFYVDKNGSGTAVYAGGNTTISTGQWYNFSGTWNGSIILVYINGVAESTTQTGVTSIGDPTTNMTIGCLHNTDGSIPNGLWNGNIGPVHIYNRALSANEVLHNYNALKSRFGL